MSLSIIVPSFDSAPWLPSTLLSIEQALSRTGFSAEVIVVDDGSKDDTQAVVSAYARGTEMHIRLLAGANQGVFLARRKGALHAVSEHLLFVDSRVVVDAAALLHLEDELTSKESFATRIGHVATDTTVPLVGRFWEVPTHVFWGRYLRKPVVTRITLDNFDMVPKGTGFLFLERKDFLEACASVSVGADRFISDDTKLLRFLAERSPLLIDPDFRATYRPRTTVRKFMAHGYLRGTLFVDSYYGTSFARTLILWLLAFSVPAAGAVLLSSATFGWQGLLWLTSGVFLLLVTGMLVVSAFNKAPWRSILSFLVYVCPFAVVFWAGVTRGLWLRARKSDR